MSYNLKNKSIAMIAVAFAAMMTFSQATYAQATTAPTETGNSVPHASDTDDLFGLDEETPDAPADTPAVLPQNEANGDVQEPAPALNEAENEAQAPNNGETAPTSPNDMLSPDVPAGSADGIDLNSLPDTSTPEGKKTLESALADSDAPAVVEAPKSPFENFGNAILSKVDNSLFNQMSNIEKQTTILNLEYKREEVRNRIEALRIQRQKAKEEEANRKKAEETRLKEEENQRKIKEMEAQEKLKRAEMELEKVRQARILNEYMNEMLVVNQKWVEKNAALQNQVQQLRDERKALIKDFENKIAAIHRETGATIQRAQDAKSSHERIVTSFKSQISNLKKTIMQNEETIQQLKSGNSANPFAEGIDENAIDMSDEYAIMDITGKGKEIVAKIINKEGTTFIVHQGSMLKGGEVVMAITDNYIAFDNKGVKSYLYTGGTVREYEPEASFNGADKTPVAAKGVVNNANVVRNVRGAATTTTGGSSGEAAPAAVSKPAAQPNKNKKVSSKPKVANVGFTGQGMFVE
ncbi:MAG: hypothetical protein Q4D80_00090 [Pseudomonadota bacterium]|nr:hypothetical protein [Pseudomonadota bacterium]